MREKIICSKSRLLVPVLVSLIVGLGMSLPPGQVEAANTYLTITEEVDQLGFDSILKFAVDTDYDNIAAFAISHPAALEGNAGISEDIVPPAFAVPPADWYATTITWDESNFNWKEYETDRVIDWLGEGDLPTDEGAWLFTSYDGSPDDNYGDALFSPATTGGFYGITDMPFSDFAALNLDPFGPSVTLTGETTVIPIPTAVWLFGSGLLALIGIVRKKKVA